MADAILGRLIDSLMEAISANAELISSLKGNVENMEDDLCALKAFLLDSRELRKNESVKQKVKQIRKLVRKAEDVVERYVLEAGQQQTRGLPMQAAHLPSHGMNLIEMAKEINDLRGKVRELDLRNMQNGSGYQRNSTENQAPIVDEANAYPLKSVKTVINLLTQGSEDLEVISIIGMPGLNKTTLSKMIHRDPGIAIQFPKLAWAYVSSKLNKKKVLLTVLRQVDNLSDETYKLLEKTNGNEEILAEKVFKALENKKYLIVLDDIWDPDHWIDLRSAFPNNKKWSRILLTSRISKVAKHAYSSRTCHLQPLDKEESWKLLKHKVHLSPWDQEMERLGRSIAKQCDGLPLAIGIVKDILIGEAKSKWESVEKKVHAEIYCERKKRMKKSVSRSFNHLTHEEKLCFIYFGMFPKYFKIPVSKLVRLWIAEDLVHPERSKSLEDTAEDYLKKLVDMNLVTVADERSSGKYKTCQVHGYLHEFCKKKAETEFSFQEFDNATHPSTSFTNYRRVGAHSLIAFQQLGSQVRSLMCFPSENDTNLPKTVPSFPKEFILLRVLDGHDLIFTDSLADLVHLINLRYLHISIILNTLPAGIASLQNMQTLIVKTTLPTLNCEPKILKMAKLKHFKTNASTCFLDETRISKKCCWPCQLSKTENGGKDKLLPNKSLETLSAISPESFEEVIDAAPCLKKLGIHGRLSKLMEISNGLSVFERIQQLTLLENLKLLNDGDKLTTLPMMKRFTPNLKKLTLAGTWLEWNHMPRLEMLKFLEILKLEDNAFTGRVWQPEEGGFRLLKELHIGKTDLVTWKASDRNFPSLSRLCLDNCSDLEKVPLGLADISSFQAINLHGTITATAVDSARAIKQKKENMVNEQTSGGIGFKLTTDP